MTPASACVLYLVDGGGDALGVAFAGGAHARDVADLNIHLGHRLSGWVAANRSSMVNGDALLDLAGLATPLNPPLHSCLSSPVFADGCTLGALTLYSTKTSPFTDGHGRLLEALAARVAPALLRIQSKAA
jgi:GAF domain-containing protein